MAADSITVRVTSCDDRGATSVEYAVMTALIAAVIVGTVGALGLSVLGLFTLLPAF